VLQKRLRRFERFRAQTNRVQHRLDGLANGDIVVDDKHGRLIISHRNAESSYDRLPAPPSRAAASVRPNTDARRS
jgi:hypothetical protein